MNYYLGLIFALALVTGQVLAFRINENDILPQAPLPFIPQDLVLERGASDQFHDFLENLRIMLRKGNDSLGIPPMEPFSAEFLDATIDEEDIKGTAELRDLYVTGLTGYHIDKATIAILARKLTIGLTWPQIYAESAYKLDVVISDSIAAYGDGKFTLTATDLSFESLLKFNITGGVQIQDIETSIKLGGLAFEATGLFGDEDTSKIVSAAISEAAPQLVQDYQAQLTKSVNEKVTNYVNARLKGKSLQDILAMLG